jgi:hypothetical protein
MYPTLLQTRDHDLRRRVVNFLSGRALTCRNLPSDVLKNLEVRVAAGVAVVSGSLPSERTKAVCLDCIGHVPGIVRLVDKVDVDAPAAEARADLRRDSIRPPHRRAARRLD